MSSIHPTESCVCRIRAWAWRSLGLVATGFFAVGLMSAQQPMPAGSPAGRPVSRSPHHRALRAQVQDPAPAEQPAPPPQPEMPKWPVNESPAKPTVTWDSQGLKILANNSSLHEIMKEVSTDTGAKVEGMGADERVFGEYGPGQASDVLSQLLHGSGYNVLMIGDQGAGTPRQIVLSARRTGKNPVNANPNPNPDENNDQPDEDYSQQDEPQPDDQSVQPPEQPQPPMINGRPPMQMVPQGPPGTPRTPQQILQELQQRQQQMMDQQQQQQPQQ